MNGRTRAANTLQLKKIALFPSLVRRPVGHTLSGLWPGAEQMLDLACLNLLNTLGLQEAL